MDEIDLSRFNFAAKDYLDILDWMVHTASDVKYFQDDRRFVDEDGRTHIQPKLIKLISSMNSLTHLIIDDYCVDDRYLDAVGKHCPNIIHLEANHAIITDLGLQSLWMNVNDPTDKTRRCQNIESLYLDFNFRGITDDGIKMLLKNLPRLKFINSISLPCNRQSTALIQMHEEDYMMCEQIYQLKEFIYYRLNYNSEEIRAKVPKILSKIAPYITTLRIVNGTTEELIQFGQLKHLQTLTLKADHESRNMFEIGILPLLEKIGSNLRNLVVSVYEMNDLLAIGSLCPKLEKFTCHFSKFNSSYPTVNYKRVFQNLKIFEFYSYDPRPLPTTYLRKILRNCEELKTLIVHSSFLLTDDLVEMIKEDLASVEYLDISRIPSVEDILLKENDLKTFKLSTRTYFDEETQTRIKQIIKENNLNLSFQYHYY